MTKDEWKRQLFEKICSEIYSGMDWNSFSNQVDEFVHVYGGELLKSGRLPPHGKYEIWTRQYMSDQIFKQYKELAIKEGLYDGKEAKETDSSKVS